MFKNVQADVTCKWHKPGGGGGEERAVSVLWSLNTGCFKDRFDCMCIEYVCILLYSIKVRALLN